MAVVSPGYMGLCEVGSNNFRCMDFALDVQQEPLFYDHVIGLRDTIPTGNATKGELDESNQFNIQKTLWRPSVSLARATFTMPLEEGNEDFWFDYARNGRELPDIRFTYYCDGPERKLTNGRVNSYTFNIVAGDIVTISVEIMGQYISENYNSIASNQVAKKLLTWDTVTINVSGLSSGISGDIIQSFTFTVQNNCKPIYTSGWNNREDNINVLMPFDIRVGMQSVQGTLTFYNRANRLYPVYGANTIYVSHPGNTFTIDALFQPLQRQGQVGALTSTMGFLGIDKALGT